MYDSSHCKRTLVLSLTYPPSHTADRVALLSPPLSSTQASIESIGESMALAEKNGVDRERVMSILSSSIFDCLIYKVRAAVASCHS
jgi:hypothetical protein